MDRRTLFKSAAALLAATPLAAFAKPMHTGGVVANRPYTTGEREPELLDDYEEGSFTCVGQTGVYTKIGNRVLISITAA